MLNDGQPLEGGNATQGVVKVGDTVRKPWSDATPSVVTYLEYLARKGVDVPRPMGRDDRGRQIMEFVPGQLASDALPLDPKALARIGRMVRRIHDASAEFPVRAGEKWDVLIPVPDADLISHNDLAPWNFIIGRRWVFIDWDGAGPSTRLWDLAYSAQSFAQIADEEPPAAAAARLRAFVDGYGADEQLRSALPEALEQRTAAMHAFLRDANESHREPWASMYSAGHGEYWTKASEYAATHRRVWREALLAKLR